MKRYLLLAVLWCFAWQGIAGVRANCGNISPASKTLTAAQMHADFDLMRHALEEAHPGLYRYSTKAQMDVGFGAQRAKLNRPMTRLEFQKVVAETLVLIRCGHTSMNRDEEREAAFKNAATFPLRVLLEGRRLMVVLNETPNDQTIRPAMEIIAINEHKSAEILDRFWSVLSADGDIETGKAHDATGRFSQLYWWLVEQPDNFTVTARDASGKTVVTTLHGVTDAERKTNQNPVNVAMKAGMEKIMRSRKDLSLRFAKDPRIAEIRIPYFVGDNYPQWVEETFKSLREKGATTLIIDLRGNGGGEDMYGAMLVSYLTDKPFRYFDHINVKTISPSFKEYSDLKIGDEAKLREGLAPDPSGGYFVTEKLHPGVAQQQPGKHPFLGKVFILIDGGTFSTAADFCAVTHHLKRASFIGEETGGGYYGNNSGSMPTLTLPISKVGIRLPTCQYWNAVPGYEGTRRGTIPDHIVQMTTEDVLHGVDAPLDLARTLAAR